VQHVLLDLDVAEGDADAQDVELVLGRREGEQHGKHIVDPLWSINKTPVGARSIDTGSVSMMIFLGAILAKMVGVTVRKLRSPSQQ
jgi:hypothetical protein